MTQMFALNGRVALVTGASRGLGRAMAKALADAGAAVMLAGRDRALLDAAAAELTAGGHKAAAASFDVTDEPAGIAAIERTLREFGRLDILVNNAGINIRKPALDYTTDEFLKVLDTNLTACFVLAREAARVMVPQKYGRIISVSSIMARTARPTIPAYVAAKGGIDAMTRALAVEFGPKGVTVNAIAPGYFETDLNVPLKSNAEFDTFVAHRTPVGRWGQPAELGGAVVFLASDAAAYVNGHTLVVDGGMTAAL